MSATYRVMLDGMATDRDREEVAAHLVRILNLSEDAARALLDSRGVVVKDGMDREAAIRVRGVLERAGCIAVVNREISSTGTARLGAQRSVGAPSIPGASGLPRVTLSPAGPEEASGRPATAPKGGGIPKAYLAIGAALALMTALIFAIGK